MGVIDSAKEVKRESPEFPESLADIYSHYKRLRFGRHENTLIPRESLTFTEVSAYAELMRSHIEPWAVGVIMSIDAIFNHRGA